MIFEQFLQLVLVSHFLFPIFPATNTFLLPTLVIKNTQSVSEITPNLLPIRLKISTIGIDSAIEYAGITEDGKMDVPKNPDTTAWFELGVYPGDIGSAVINGHSGWKDGIPAVFDDLYKIKIGDKLYIEDKFGKSITFVVRELRVYDPKADTSEIFISNDEKAHLNLITCEGAWDSVSKSSPKRLVVLTDKE